MGPLVRCRKLRILPALCLVVVLSACASPKPIFRGKPLGNAVEALSSHEPSAPPSRHTIEEVASVWLGTPYRYGGTSDRGVDCSALCQHILGDLGVQVPRTVRDQLDVGRRISPGEIAPGDLVFFRLESNRVNHVGIALDRQRFVHASTSRGVIVDHMMDKYFARRFAEARRVLEPR